MKTNILSSNDNFFNLHSLNSPHFGHSNIESLLRGDPHFLILHVNKEPLHVGFLIDSVFLGQIIILD